MFNEEVLLKNDDSKKTAFQNLQTMIKSVPDLDYDKELSEYRDNRYNTTDKTNNISC